MAECNPSLPSRKHQHVIILTVAALQLTVIYSREILLVAVLRHFAKNVGHKQDNSQLKTTEKMKTFS